MNDKQQLMQFEKDWDRAIETNDVEAISRFMSPDWVIIGSGPGITSKESFLNEIRSGHLVHSRMDFEKLRIEIYDKTGIITSRGTSAGYYKGEPFSLYEWSTSIFIRESGGWVCVLTMLTPAVEGN